MMSMSNRFWLACAHLATSIRAPLPNQNIGGTTITQRQLSPKFLCVS
jgi:hypothetical protein